MQMQPPTPPTAEHSPAYLRVLHILALASLSVYILIVAASLLIPIAVAAFLAMLLAPVSGWLEKMRLGRMLAALVPVLGLLSSLSLLISLAVRQISIMGGSLDGAGQRVDSVMDRLNYFLGWHLNLDEPVLGDLNGEGVVNLVKDSSGQLLSMMGDFTGSLFAAIIVPALMFFILYYRCHLFEFSVRFLQRASRKNVADGMEEARMVVQNYFTGMTKVVVILAILNAGALTLIGVQHAVFFGVFAAMLNIVPFVGPLIGSLLPVLFVFLTRDSLYYPLAVAAVFIAIQLIESNFLTPRIVGSNVRINPLVVFVGLLAGYMVWGTVGMIIIIPVLSISMQLLRLDPRSASFAYLLGIPPRQNG